jgi:hypothetical protein
MSVSSSSIDRPTPTGVRDDVGLDRTVWFGGEAYHRASEAPSARRQIRQDVYGQRGERVA